MLLGIETAVESLEAIAEGYHEPPASWRDWAPTIFPGTFHQPFAPYHEALWEWAWRIRLGERVEPFVGIWPRGWAKSTNGEGVVTALGAEGHRKYAVYVRETQDQADNSVSNIAAMLESPNFSKYYPEHADRSVGKYGNSKGWRRNRLMTAGGFTVDALGLDSAMRGARIDEQRPDLVILDDVDSKFDTPRTTKKKERQITHSIVPMGSPDVVFLVLQNLIIPDGVVSRLADGRADYLSDRQVSGPFPAIYDAEFETERQEDGSIRVQITAGEPSWPAMDIEKCELLIKNEGLRAFEEERQHNVHEREGALWTKDLIDSTRVHELPSLIVEAGVGVDPSGGVGEVGAIVAGKGPNGHAYVWADRSKKGEAGPLAWGREVVEAYHRWKLDKVIAEPNFGGALVSSNIQVAARDIASERPGLPKKIPVRMVASSRGKALRAAPVASEWEAGNVHIVGHLPILEREMTSWVPGDSQWSPNRLDALVFIVTWLLLTGDHQEEPPPASTSYPSIY